MGEQLVSDSAKFWGPFSQGFLGGNLASFAPNSPGEGYRPEGRISSAEVLELNVSLLKKSITGVLER